MTDISKEYTFPHLAGTWYHGINIRDLFAVVAMHGLLSSDGSKYTDARLVALDAYDVADAMISRRDKR